MPKVFVSVGSSLHRYGSVSDGLSTLSEEFDALQVSPVFESEAVGFDGPAFLNLAVSFTTSLDVVSLITRLKEIEDQHGRDRTLPKFAARTLDLDLLTYGSHSGVLNGITLPRQELFEHAFVLWPMAELAPDSICPGGEDTYAQLWKSWQGNQVLKPVTLRWSLGEISADQTRFGYSVQVASRE